MHIYNTFHNHELSSSYRFGYPHYLHIKSFSGVKCVWADVMCQYWPWALSKVNCCLESKQAMSAHPCLSVMHAKAHSWHCQVNKQYMHVTVLSLSLIIIHHTNTGYMGRKMAK